MGCFNATCIVSGLPIEGGDPVRFLALARSKYHPEGNDHVCYVGGRWQVYGVPVKAPYNEYGSVNVEDLEESFTTTMFFEGLKRGAVEKGVGDNSAHDVAVNPDMDLEDWIEALWEGRVEVLDHRRPSPLDEVETILGVSLRKEVPDDGNPVGLPTLRRIQKVLTDAGKELSTSYGNGYLVDEVAHGFIRVRHGDYASRVQAIEAAVPLFQAAGYAAMITAGTGNYADPSEVLVGPLPSKDPNVHIHTAGLSKSEDKYNAPRPVSLAMIREDVWQVLLAMNVSDWSRSFTIEDFRKAALEAATEEVESKARFAAMTPEERIKALEKSALRDLYPPQNNLFLAFLGGHEGLSGYTFGAAYRLACEVYTDPEDLKKYALDLADMVYVQFVYSNLHGQWHPTTNSGQEANWKDHHEFLLKLVSISEEKLEGDDEEEIEGDDEAEDEEPVEATETPPPPPDYYSTGMVYWSVVFFGIAFIGAIVGFGGFGLLVDAADVAKILFVTFLGLALVSLLFARLPR